MQGSSAIREIKQATNVFAEDRIESDLGIIHLDSLNLIDIILELKKEGIKISDADAESLFKANSDDLTVAEIINEVIRIVEKSN